MIRSVQTHTKRILTTLPAILTFAVLFGLVLYNFVIQVLTNAVVREASQMNDPMRMLTLSEESSMTLSREDGLNFYSLANTYLLLLYPALVSFPVCSLWISDRGSGMVNYFDARSGRRAFWFGKLIAVFLSTFVIFTLPFLLEILLGIFSFPASAKGSPGTDYLRTIQDERLYFMPELLGKSTVLYAVVMTLLFGLVSGIFGCFTYACSTLPFMRFRVLNFLPVIVLLYGGILLQGVFFRGTQLTYLVLMKMFFPQTGGKYPIPLYTGILAGLLLISAGIIFLRSGKDELS